MGVRQLIATMREFRGRLLSLVADLDDRADDRPALGDRQSAAVGDRPCRLVPGVLGAAPLARREADPGKLATGFITPPMSPTTLAGSCLLPNASDTLGLHERSARALHRPHRRQIRTIARRVLLLLVGDLSRRHALPKRSPTRARLWAIRRRGFSSYPRWVTLSIRALGPAMSKFPAESFLSARPRMSRLYSTTRNGPMRSRSNRSASLARL